MSNGMRTQNNVKWAAQKIAPNPLFPSAGSNVIYGATSAAAQQRLVKEVEVLRIVVVAALEVLKEHTLMPDQVDMFKLARLVHADLTRPTS